jgi:hypothetical protein
MGDGGKEGDEKEQQQQKKNDKTEPHLLGTLLSFHSFWILADSIYYASIVIQNLKLEILDPRSKLLGFLPCQVWPLTYISQIEHREEQRKEIYYTSSGYAWEEAK